MIFEGVITLLLLSKVRCVPVEDVPEVQISFSSTETALDYLNKYGYTNVVTSFSGGGGGRDVIKKFQDDAGIPQTGVLDAETMEVMSSPRCGVFVENQGGQKWNKRELTYRVIKYSAKLSNNAIDRIVRSAMDFWEAAADIKFTRSKTRKVDIEIIFGRREHGDKIPFDGPSGTLAHAFFPGSFGGGLAGDAHFDDDEDWSETVNRGKQLLQTCTHELGHSLGLGHSKVRGSVMYFAYPGWDANLKLHRDDISRIQNLYGPSRPGGRPQPPSTPGPGPKGGSCSCSSFTRYDEDRNGRVGNCRTEYNGRVWCYINPGADCPDSRRSSFGDRDWSYEACDGRDVSTTRRPTRRPTIPTTRGPRPGNCQCNGKSRFNERLQETVGLCQSRYRGKVWCYVSSNSPCSDKDDTERNEDGFRYWSTAACDNESPFQIGQVDSQIVDDSPFHVDQQVIDTEP